MPKRSFNSVKIKPPDRETVLAALNEWAQRTAGERPDVDRIGYFGSYARESAGPASDLDILIVLLKSDKPPHRRILDYPVDGVPVGCEVFPFTIDEINRKSTRPGWMQSVMSEVRWIAEK